MPSEEVKKNQERNINSKKRFEKLGVKITVINYLSSMIAKVVMILLVVMVM